MAKYFNKIDHDLEIFEQQIREYFEWFKLDSSRKGFGQRDAQG